MDLTTYRTRDTRHHSAVPTADSSGASAAIVSVTSSLRRSPLRLCRSSRTRGDRRDMAWACCVSGTLASVTAPLLGDILCFCSLAVSHPLLLAYLLFFSPYLLVALSFLGPLLISTCFLLLALLTVSPYLRGSPPSPAPPPPPDGGHIPGPFGTTLRLVLDMLDPSAGGETELLPPPEALFDIASALQACVNSVEEMYRERGEAAAVAEGASPGDDGEEEEAEEEEKRIVVEAAPSSNELFGWELEAISKLYKALTYEVEEFPVKLALRSFKEGELFLPEIGSFQGGDRKLQAGEPGEDLPQKETPCSAEFQVRGRKVPTCEDVDIPLGNASKSATKSRDCGDLPDRNLTREISSPPKRPTPSSKGISRSGSDGSRSGKLLQLRRSSSSSSTSAAAAAGLSRVASSRGRSAAGTKGTQPQALSSSGSMRKEKEWRRTLACKLFEERMVADGGEEGMDLLWETYELGPGKVEGDSSCRSKKISHSSHDKGRGRKQESIKSKRLGELHIDDGVGVEDDDEDEEEEEEATAGRLCCLQALRFSTSKMGLGMGRSGLLLKVSKAMKGVGVFRRAAPRPSRKTG
ncbi:hypothetical protein Taro_038968 [Colocasia esculenta]|uniref:Uncharacterized protein n=1 Tax=Colocasia esculenta TaxID=4460 RepID=A0A843WHF6_COLES|nr:hypothetical protein [Colocasia esculenta]